jgi:hypothetical protein
MSLTNLRFQQISGTFVWRVPKPQTREHPGASDAPVSSPKTYKDETGFARRARLIVENVAKNDLAQWRRGYFAGGDPGKYLPGAAMARLLLRSDDAEARRYMNDDRSPNENYHFAAVNWARFLPLFGESLTEQTKTKLAQTAGRFGAYLNPSGTENHKTMNMTAANVLPHYLAGGGRLGNQSKEAALAEAKRQLKAYVKGLYAAGMGEWDSSTYLMFGVNGMLNIYDFSPDLECRLLAKAALDWYAAGYALKYTGGVFCAPNQRGFAASPLQKIADQTGWLWWGDAPDPAPEAAQRFLYALHPVTSSWRPNQVICNIARRDIKGLFPVEQINTKPNYWYGQNLKPTPGEYTETVYVTKHYTMGSLWNGFGGQITRFQIVAKTKNGGVSFTGGHPRHSDHTGKKTDGVSYEDGGGRYDQTAQVGNTYVCLTKTPADEPLDYVFFTVPEEVKELEKLQDGLWLLTVGDTFLAVYSLGERAELAEADVPEKERGKRKGQRIIKFYGRKTGFVVVTGDREQYSNVLQLYRSGLKPFMEQWKVSDTLMLATKGPFYMTVTYQAGKDRPLVQSRPQVAFDPAAVYSGPLLKQNSGILTVSDGQDAFTVDFSGDLPMYRRG